MKTKPCEYHDEFFSKYKPLAPPPGEADGSMHYNIAPSICLDMSWRLDSKTIQYADPRCIWTMLWLDEGQHIVQGKHFINRAYYFLCEIPFEDGDISEYCDY